MKWVVAFVVAFMCVSSSAFAVPWQMTNSGLTVWLTDAQLSQLENTGSIQLTPDSAGNGGYCVRPVQRMGQAVSNAGVRTNVVTCAYSRTPGRPPGNCSNLAGDWVNTVPFGTSTWTLRAQGGGRYTATEQGMGNAQGTATFSGNVLTVDFRTGVYVGRYQWYLDAQCRNGRGTLSFSAGRNDSFHNVTVVRR